jgi:hypothetical protein
LGAGAAGQRGGDVRQRQRAAIADTAALLARLPDSAAPKVFSKGLRGDAPLPGAGRAEEAQQAFPHVMKLALPSCCAAAHRARMKTPLVLTR